MNVQGEKMIITNQVTETTVQSIYLGKYLGVLMTLHFNKLYLKLQVYLLRKK